MAPPKTDVNDTPDVSDRDSPDSPRKPHFTFRRYQNVGSTDQAPRAPTSQVPPSLAAHPPSSRAGQVAAPPVNQAGSDEHRPTGPASSLARQAPPSYASRNPATRPPSSQAGQIVAPPVDRTRSSNSQSTGPASSLARQAPSSRAGQIAAPPVSWTGSDERRPTGPASSLARQPPSSQAGQTVAPPTQDQSSDSPPAGRRKPRPSIYSDTRDVQKLKRFTESVAQQAKDLEIDEYDELTDIMEAVKVTRESVTKVETFRKTHLDYDIKVVSFSNTSQEDLDRIGLPSPKVIGSDRLLSIIHSNLSRPVLNYIQTSAQELEPQLDELRAFVSTQNEAGARIIINRILLEARRICDQKLRKSLFLRVELGLTPHQRPKPIKHGKVATLVSGLIDYGIGAASKGNKNDELEHIRDGPQKLDAVSALGELRNTFVVVEAKSDKETLLDHLPQAICQCMAVPDEFISLKSSEGSFCLANSEQWVFGVMDRGEHPMACHTTPLSTNQELATILKALVFWVATKSSTIYSAAMA